MNGKRLQTINSNGKALKYLIMEYKKLKILQIIYKLSKGEIKYNLASKQVLDIGMFSSDKLEQAYKDGVRDALAKGYGTFDKKNYR